MPQIKNVSGPTGGLIEDLSRAAAEFVAWGEEGQWIEVALDGAVMADAIPALVEADAPVETDHVTTRGGHVGEEFGIAGAEVNGGDAGSELGEHLLDVRLHVADVVVGTKAADPTVEKLNGLRTCGDLGVEVERDGTAQAFHQRLPRGLVAIHERFRVEIRAAGSAFDGVTGEREWRTGETDQRDVRRQVGPRLSDGFDDVVKCVGAFQIGNPIDVLRFADGIVNDGTVARREFKFHAHRFEDRQEIGKDDCRIDAEPFDGNAHHFAGQLWVLAEIEERSLGADFPILGHVAPRLPHQPDGRVGRRLATAGFHEWAVVPRLTYTDPIAARFRTLRDAERFNDLSLTCEDFRGSLGGFLHQVSHLGVARFQVDGKLLLGEHFTRCGADGGDNHVSHRCAKRRFQVELVRHGEQISDLIGRGEHEHVHFAGCDAADVFFQRRSILWQRPLINLDGIDGRAAGFQPGDEAGIGNAVLLKSQSEVGDGQVSIERGEQFAPGIRLGDDERGGDAPLPHHGQRFGAADDRLDVGDRAEKRVAIDVPLDLLQQHTRADSGEKDDRIDLPGHDAVREFDGGTILLQRDFAHRRADEGHPTKALDETLDVFCAATFKSCNA